MQEVTFTLQTITPLFLAGADQTKAELRAPSFRGVLRYWLRALVGGLVGADDTGLRQVIEVEADVFGTTVTPREEMSNQLAGIFRLKQTFRSFSRREPILIPKRLNEPLPPSGF